MGYSVDFRLFEERDINFVYQCKNDNKLNELVVGNWHPLTFEEAEQWVRNCMKGDRPDLKFWAICTKDDERRIIGWVSMSQIDLVNRCACFNGIVIGDNKYREGLAWIDAYLFIYKYGFEELHLNRIYGSALVNHLASQTIRKVMFSRTEGVLKEAIYRNDCFYDVSIGALLSKDYFNHKINGEYELSSILKRMHKIKKENI